MYHFNENSRDSNVYEKTYHGNGENHMSLEDNNHTCHQWLDFCTNIFHFHHIGNPWFHVHCKGKLKITIKLCHVYRWLVKKVFTLTMGKTKISWFALITIYTSNVIFTGTLSSCLIARNFQRSFWMAHTIWKLISMKKMLICKHIYNNRNWPNLHNLDVHNIPQGNIHNHFH